MQKEIIQNKSLSLSVNVSANTVTSLRRIVEKTSTVRVYDNGFVGIAGQIGNANLNELEKSAIEKLQDQVPYPCNLAHDVQKSVDERKEIIDVNSFVKICQRLLKKISTACPSFIFSNKIRYTESSVDYQNSCNTHLHYDGNTFSVSLVIKHKQSANIMDFGFSDKITKYDEDTVVNNIKLMCDTFEKNADIEDGDYPIITFGYDYLVDPIQHLIGEMYANQASLLKGRLNEVVFNDNLSLLREDAIETPFFDDEGEVIDEHNAYLVKDGKFVGVLANKKIAAEYNLPRMACSNADYDKLPGISLSGFACKNTHENLHDIIGDGKAILIVDASGGDMTSSGDYATPIQVPFLVENGKLVGKLPPLNLTGNMMNYLNEGFMGVTKNGFFQSEQTQYVVAKMHVSKI